MKKIRFVKKGIKFSRSFQLASYSFTTILLVGGILVLLNILAQNIFLRADLTKNQLYSLTDSSKEMVKELPDVVNVDVYFSIDVDNNLNNMREYLVDLLREYDTVGGSNFVFTMHNVQSDDNDMIQEAQDQGISLLNYRVYENNSYTSKNIVAGAIIRYGNNPPAVIDQFQDTSDYEYQITSAVKKITAPDSFRIGIVTSEGQSDASLSMYHTFLSTLETEYSVSYLTFEELEATDLQTLLVLGVDEALDEPALYALDQSIVSGKNIVIFYDTYSLSTGSLAVFDNSLKPLLQSYGIDPDGLVFDSDAMVQSIPVSSNSYAYTSFPPYPNVRDFGDQPFVTSVGEIGFPLVSPLVVTDQSNIRVFASSNPTSWKESEDFQISYDLGTYSTSASSMQSYPIALEWTGAIQSNFDGPVDFPQSGDGEDVSKEGTSRDYIDSIPHSSLAVVGSSYYLLDSFLSSSNSGYVFTLAIIDNMSSNDELVASRSKNVQPSYIKKDLGSFYKNTFTYLIMIGYPLFLGILFIIRFVIRSRLTRRKYSV